LTAVLRQAEERGVPIRRVSAGDLDRAARQGAHQGVVADVRDADHLSVEDLVIGARGAPLIVVLDGIEDDDERRGRRRRRAAVASRGAAWRRDREGVGGRRVARADR